jgi:RNA polymerase sigma-70 factor (ECF subfamily)
VFPLDIDRPLASWALPRHDFLRRRSPTLHGLRVTVNYCWPRLAYMPDPSVECTTQFLLSSVRAGDPMARERLIARIEPLLMRFARGRVPQFLRYEQDTSDLVQSTWLRVLDKLDQIALQRPGDFFAYVRATLINALREALRKHGRAPVARDGLEHAGIEESLPAEGVDLDDWLSYEQALARLSPETRNLVLMRFEFGMSFSEIGVELAESPDAVRMRLTRALAGMSKS